MANLIESPEIAGVVVVEPVVHRDQRGLFVETYRREWFPRSREMVQNNRGDRQRGSVVGFHYHLYQTDYWYVPAGRAQVVLHDLRVGSPTDGATMSLELGAQDGSDQDHRGVFIPPGVAHAFAALTDMTITYLVDDYYDPADELGVAWDDPDIAADWQVDEPILSERDLNHPGRAEIEPRWRPRYDTASVGGSA